MYIEDFIGFIQRKKKGKGTMQTNRRTGITRRKQQSSSSDERRKSEDRRMILKNPDEIIERFKKIPMFEGLTKTQLKRMLGICSKKKYNANDNIYSIGDDSKNMFILLKGKIGIMYKSGVDLQSISPAGTVGEMGIFTGNKRSANVVAVTECLILNFNKEELFTLFRNDTDLYIKILHNVIKDLCVKMSKGNEQIDQLLYRIRVLDIM